MRPGRGWRFPPAAPADALAFALGHGGRRLWLRKPFRCARIWIWRVGGPHVPRDRGGDPPLHQVTGSSVRPQLGPLEHLSRAPLVTARLHSPVLGVEKGSHPTTVTGEPEPRFSERQAHRRASSGSVRASISPTRRAPPGIAVDTGHGDVAHSAPLCSAGVRIP